MKIKGLTPLLLVILLVMVFTGNLNILQGPLTDFMTWSEEVIGGQNAVGWSIIILTLGVRLILMPMMVQQQHAATVQQEKMRLLQPQLKKVQEAQKQAKTQEEQMRASQAMMAIYRENGVSMLGGMNFSTIIIQWPIFIGLYDAIRASKDLASATFFGISLADKSMILALGTALAYGVQAYLSMIGIPEEQKKSMSMMMYVMPVMMFFMTMVTNGGIALYFFAGAIVMIMQQVIITLWRPSIRRRVFETFEVKDVVDDALAGNLTTAQTGAIANALKSAQKQQPSADRKDVTPSSSALDEQALRERNRKQNAGKQG